MGPDNVQVACPQPWRGGGVLKVGRRRTSASTRTQSAPVLAEKLLLRRPLSVRFREVAPHALGRLCASRYAEQKSMPEFRNELVSDFRRRLLEGLVSFKQGDKDEPDFESGLRNLEKSYAIFSTTDV